MKVQIPDELKQDAPKNHWGKVLTATPVIMTVVATMLAGLSLQATFIDVGTPAIAIQPWMSKPRSVRIVSVTPAA